MRKTGGQHAADSQTDLSLISGKILRQSNQIRVLETFKSGEKTASNVATCHQTRSPLPVFLASAARTQRRTVACATPISRSMADQLMPL